MLYVKLDEQKNPIEFAKSYQMIAREFSEQNKIIPAESLFLEKYGQVPISEMPERINGKTIMPDIPVKNADGTYQRTWKYVDAVGDPTDLERSQMDLIMKTRRKAYLEKFADTVSPLRWNSWTAEQQQEVTDWYQSVLDMTNDPAWPYMHFPNLPSPIK